MMKEQQIDFIDMIRRGYKYELTLDHLPSATQVMSDDGQEVDDYKEGIDIDAIQWAHH